MVAEKLIVGGFYFVDHFVSNINTNEFTDKKKNIAKQKEFTSIIQSVISLMSKAYCRQKRQFVIPLIINFELPIKLITR
jgi:hypothetical protein